MLKMNIKQKIQWKQMLIIGVVIISSCFVVSCKDDYYYDDREPEWLGASIYDYLNEDGSYTYFVKLIDDVGYTPVLQRTGSKTLFVAKDDAFERFFQDNIWGVSSYDKLSLSQKKLILNFGMVNNAFLIETLANHNDGSLVLGTSIRRSTAVSVLDSIEVEIGDGLPDGEYWDAYKGSGIHLLKDNTNSPLVYFLSSTLGNIGITDEDFKIITGVDRSNGDAHVFDKKVIEQDITCKNGYVHVLEDVLIPPTNMAEYLREDGDVSEFSKLMERYSAPYYNDDATSTYKQLNPGFSDSIFTKEYFSAVGGRTIYPGGEITDLVDENLWLPYNPGWNSYRKVLSNGSFDALQADMAAIFAPTDLAMQQYLESGSGMVIKERYGSWDNVPDDIIALFLKRHMRESFVESLPSTFDKLRDSENSKIPIQASDVVDAYVGVNGVVYKTSEVYPPDDFESVYGPVLFSEKTKVFNWAIRENDFRLYLNSLESRYSFFVPTDEFFKNYIDPIAYGKDVPGALKFWYNEATKVVNATVYSYNTETGVVGDSIGVITSTGLISNRLLDLLDSHVVVGNVESGNQFYFTKGGNTLKVEGTGGNLKIQGGGDIENNNTVGVVEVIEQKNGTTYFVDKPIQTPMRSVYKVLSETPEFSEFFDLLVGFSSASNSVVFVKKTNYYGIDFNIKFFNTFNYTVYVPTNEAIQQAIADGIIHNWDEINAVTDVTIRDQYVAQLERFLRYHFQDNSVYVGDDSFYYEYQTATIKNDDVVTRFNTFKNKYYKLGIESDGNNLTLETEGYGSAHVVKDNGLYNILSRDYIFNDSPNQFGDINQSGYGSKEFTDSRITTSSTAVIHQIDNVLKFD